MCSAREPLIKHLEDNDKIDTVVQSLENLQTLKNVCKDLFGTNVEEITKESSEKYIVCSVKKEHSFEDQETVLDGGWGWLITVGTTLISVFICSVQSYFGILFSRPLLDMNASSTQILWIFNILNVLLNLMGLLLGPLVQVLGWRVVAMGSTALFSLAFFISAFATSPYHLVISFSIMGGISSGLCVAITHTISPHYFKKYLGIANAFPMGGVCLGGFMLPPLITYLLDEYAYKGTMLILAAIILNATAAAALFHLPEWHKQKINNKIQSPKTQTYGSQLVKFSEICFQVLKNVFENIKILQNTRAIIITFGSVLFINSVINFFGFVPFYLQNAGHSLETSAWLVSISSIMNFIARIFFSMISDLKWFNKRVCFMTGLLLCSITTLGFSFTTDLTWCTALLSLFGFGFGCSFCMYSLVMVEYMGVKNLGAVYGANALMVSSGFLTIGPLLGYVKDVSDSFVVVFWILGAMTSTAFCMWLFMPAAVIYDSNRDRTKDNMNSA